VVSNEAESYTALRHFQVNYPADERAFFASSRERELANRVLDGCKATWPQAFKKERLALSSRAGARRGDPDRPFLTDNLLLGMIWKGGLLAPGVARGREVMVSLLDSARGQEMGGRRATVVAEDAAAGKCELEVAGLEGGPVRISVAYSKVEAMQALTRIGKVNCGY